MEIYSKIKKDVKQYFIDKGKPEVAKNIPKIFDLYMIYIVKAVGYKEVLGVRNRGIKLRLKIRPMFYLTKEMYKHMMISSLNSNYIFEVKMEWEQLKKNRFTFKTMKRFKYLLKKFALDNDNVYKLIQNYEKSVL